MRSDEASAAEVFEEHRGLLFSIAYRMLGSATDAEDVLQEAYLRWREVAADEIRSPRAYLSTVVTRLCMDQLRSARARREEYAGPWLPEPLVVDAADDPALLDETLSMAFLVLLESLSPVERAVFLLREVFDYDYAGISEIVGKSEANCRQIARRAREAVAARRPRFDPAPGQGERLVRRFIEACMSGDMEDLLESMSEEITLWTDGGGRVRAARNPIHGSDRVARFLLGVIPEASEELEIRYARVNGQPGLITYHPDGSPQGAVAFDVSGGRIAAIRFVVNPEKLRSIPPLEEVEQ
ncbi:RNA polymerase sigma-70 factor [Rubrobacter naiadicus]|uniref:RNA polymerase sigma-70 factor n=1 Tax=Rubrobacter naiadicus TaxID=1392641 RepID=UPI00235FE757|nr:RNA polymerase sigma-70 factor [Rubrobacter naiadicus]